MMVSDLDHIHHRASINNGLISVGPYELTADEFTFAGLIAVAYDAGEERELETIGLLAALRTQKKPARLSGPTSNRRKKCCAPYFR